MFVNSPRLNLYSSGSIFNSRRGGPQWTLGLASMIWGPNVGRPQKFGWL